MLMNVFGPEVGERAEADLPAIRKDMDLEFVYSPEKVEEPCGQCGELTKYRTLSNANPVCDKCGETYHYAVKIPNWILRLEEE